jgi:hypothetical protein
MSQPGSPPAAPPTGGAEDLRIVLFGMPAAGKSSLLGALSLAAQAQEPLLHGRLTDVSHGLGELQRRLYDQAGQATAEEVFPYPVTYEPFGADGKSEPDERVNAVVIDCDGRVANDLLVHRKELAEDSPEGTLAHEVIEADTLVLVIDASAPQSQIDLDFEEFERFLRQMVRDRGRRTEIGGLPVFLVLTKCDLLAHPGDGPADWLERIEQRKRDVDARFRALLSQRQKEGAGFGRIDLHVWATAVKRPALKGVPAKAREPFGVAELFRQCLEKADEFRDREKKAGRRLFWTVGAACALLLGMAGVTTGLFLHNRAGLADALRSRVEDFRLLDRGGPAERLRGSEDELRRKQDSLLAMRNDALFTSLPESDQQFVEERLDELRAYLAFRETLSKEPRVASAHNEAALLQMQKRLQNELAMPRPEWEGTEADELLQQRRAAIEGLLKAVSQAQNYYLDSSEAASKLWTFADYKVGPGEAGIDWPDWAAQVEKLIDPARKPPFNAAQSIPGITPPITWAVPLRFDKVVEAEAVWQNDQNKLKRLLDLTTALGIVPATKEKPAALVVTKGISLPKAKELFGQFKWTYPALVKEIAPADLPDAALPRIRMEARRNYQALLLPGRQEVLRRLQEGGKGPPEDPSRWDALRSWLKKPKELSGWSSLAAVLARLADPDALDPVEALASFLARDRFNLNIRTLTLEVPERVGVRPRSDAKLNLFHPASDRKPAVSFEIVGDPRRDARRQVWIYNYRATARQPLVYKPADKLWAEVVLPGERQFTWSQARTKTYQFERLREPPRLQKIADPTLYDGPLQDTVKLTISPEDGVPRVPDLLPQIKP